MRRKTGQPPIGERAMTSTERTRRWREKKLANEPPHNLFGIEPSMLGLDPSMVGFDFERPTMEQLLELGPNDKPVTFEEML